MTNAARLLMVLVLVGACSSGGSDDAAPDTTIAFGDTAVDDESGGGSSEVTTTTSTAPSVDDPERPPLVRALEAVGAQPEGWTGRDGILTFVAPGFDTGTTDPVGAARAYLERFADAYQVDDVDLRFVELSTVETLAGTVVRFDQRIDDLSVFAGTIAVTVAEDGVVTDVSGVVVPTATLPDAVLDASAAGAIAAGLGPTGTTVEEEPALVVFSPAVDRASTDPSVPAWDVTIVIPDVVPLRDRVIVHAVDGTVLLREGLDVDAENWDLSDAQNQLDDDGKAAIADAELVMQANDGEITEIGTPDSVARALAGHLTTTYEYFLNTHGLDGFDGAGGRCDAYIHVGVEWRNATASSNCVMRYGDALPYAESLDVVAHEVMHAVNNETANLVYQGQSGALNEHYSDFFGLMVSRDDWVVDIVNRDFSAPRVDRLSAFLVTEDDRGGVHTNSGIGNMASYLVANEGMNVHPSTGIEVRGIGLARAETLWWATLLSLGPRTTIAGWACASISRASGLHGAGVLDPDDVVSVGAAMAAIEAVDLDDPLNPCQYGSVGIVPELDDDGGSDPEPEDPTTTEPVPPTSVDDVACGTIGSWRLRDQDFIDEIMRRTADVRTVEIRYYSGDYIVDIAADGTLVSRRAEWSVRESSPEGAIVLRISSVDPGTWNEQDNTLSISEASSETVDVFLDMDGSLVPVPGAARGLEIFGVEGTGTYTCEGDVLTVTIGLEGAPFTVRFDRIG